MLLSTDSAPSALEVHVPPKRRPWGESEVAALRGRYPTAAPVFDLASDLGRTVGSVRGKAYRLGLRRPRKGAAPSGAPARAEVAEAAGAPLLLRGVPRLAVEPPPPLGPRRPKKPFRRTALGGREIVWSDAKVERLIRLWIAGFHHAVISEVLGVGPRAAVSKANKISLPCRRGRDLSCDAQAARALDAAGGALPRELRNPAGQRLILRRCGLGGHLFFGVIGIHTCPETKQTLHYQRLHAGM